MDTIIFPLECKASGIEQDRIVWKLWDVYYIFIKSLSFFSVTYV